MKIETIDQLKNITKVVLWVAIIGWIAAIYIDHTLHPETYQVVYEFDRHGYNINLDYIDINATEDDPCQCDLVCLQENRALQNIYYWIGWLKIIVVPIVIVYIILGIMSRPDWLKKLRRMGK